MTKEFSYSLEGLISQLHAKEPMILDSEKLSPRKVRSTAKRGLRLMIAKGDGILIDKDDMKKAARALGYVTEVKIDFEDIRENCRRHLRLQRYFSLNYAEELAIKTLEFTLGNIIYYSYQACCSIKRKVIG